MSYAQLGRQIQRAREKAGFSQEQLALILGCSQPTLSNYEKGKSRIYLTQLQKLAQALNQPMSYFLEATDMDEDSPGLNRNQTPAQEGNGIRIDQEILEILRILYRLPEPNRKSIYEFVLWQEYKAKSGNKE